MRCDRAHAEALREEAAAVLAPMGLRLSTEKTKITHIDEGLDFLGWRIQRHRKRGTAKSFVYTYPSKKAVRAVTGKVRTLSRLNKNLPLEVLLHTEPRATRLVHLLPAGCVQRDLPLPACLRLAQGHRMAAP